jgi:hypothetical protein
MRVGIVAVASAMAAGACGHPHNGGARQVSLGDSTMISQPDSAGLKRYEIIKQRILRADGFFLRETSDQHCCLGGERNTWGTISLQRFTDSTLKAVAWRTTLTADTGEVWAPFYEAVLEGCCDASNQITFFDLDSGRPTFVLSQYWSSARGLPSLTRGPGQAPTYFAFVDRYIEAEPPEAKVDSTVVGVLEYGPSGGPINRVVVRTTRGPAINVQLERLALSRGGIEQDSLHLQAPVTSREIAINVHLIDTHSDEPNDGRIRIPVEAGQLLLARAIVPPGFVVAVSSWKPDSVARPPN